MRTSFSADAAAFSQLAHLAARAPIYEPLFPGGVEFEDVTKTAADLDYAIDRQLAVTVDGLTAPLRVSAQERFRTPPYMRYPDVTVTEWNLASNLPSELHKFCAQLFVYGFYDQAKNEILAGVVVDAARMLLAFAQDRLPSETQRRDGRDQSFRCFKVGDLENVGAVIAVYKRDEWRDAVIAGL